VGFAGTPDDLDISLWRPFFKRRVEHFLLSDTPEQLHNRNIEYAVVGGLNLGMNGTTLDAWMQKTGAELVGQTNVVIKLTEGLQSWYVVRFRGR
jgi:hypothetical protein